jgi:hypothetical protein
MGFTASTLLDRWAKTAARDGVSCGGYGLRVMPTGEFQTSQHSDLDREDAIQIVTDNMTQTITAPAPAACPAPASEPKAPKDWTPRIPPSGSDDAGSPPAVKVDPEPNAA